MEEFIRAYLFSERSASVLNFPSMRASCFELRSPSISIAIKTNCLGSASPATFHFAAARVSALGPFTTISAGMDGAAVGVEEAAAFLEARGCFDLRFTYPSGFQQAATL